MKAHKLATDAAPIPTASQASDESPPDILDIIRTKLLMASARGDAESILDTVRTIPERHALEIGQDDEVMRAIGDALTYEQALGLVPKLGRLPPTDHGLTLLPNEDLGELEDLDDQNIETFQEDLGEATHYSAMAKVLGTLIDARTKGPGSFCKGKATLTFRFPPPVPGGPTPKSGYELRLIFEVGAARGEKKMKVKTGLGIQVVYAAKLGKLKAEVGAMLMATATAQGQNGPHCLDLIGLGVLKQIEAFLGRDGKDQLFGQKFQERVIDSMDAVDAKKPEKLKRQHRISDDQFERRNRKLDVPAYMDKKFERTAARERYEQDGEAYNKSMKNADYVEMGSSLTLHGKVARDDEDELKAEAGYERSRKYYKSNKGDLKKTDVEQYVFAAGTVKFGNSKAKVKIKIGVGKKTAGKTKLDVEGEQTIKFEDGAYLREMLFRTTVGMAADIKQIATKGKRQPDASFYENLDSSFGAMTSSQFQPFVDLMLKEIEPSEAANQRRISAGKTPKAFKFKAKSKIGLEYSSESYGPTSSDKLSLSATNTRTASIDGGAVKGEIEVGAGNKVNIFERKGSGKDMKKGERINGVPIDEMILEPDALLEDRAAAAVG